MNTNYPNEAGQHVDSITYITKTTVFHIIAIDDRTWGKGATLDEALATWRKHRPSNRRGGKPAVYLVHPDTDVDGLGGLGYPKSFPPRKIAEYQPPKRLRSQRKNKQQTQ